MKRTLAGLALAVTLTGCSVSTQQEIEMGQQYAQQINQQFFAWLDQRRKDVRVQFIQGALE